MGEPRIEIPKEKIKSFCKRWKVIELALFGSVLRADFRPDSDIDVLISFSPQAHWTLFDLFQMKEELEEIYGRSIDLVSRRGLENSRNYLRRQSILDSMKVVHAA